MSWAILRPAVLFGGDARCCIGHRAVEHARTLRRIPGALADPHKLVARQTRLVQRVLRVGRGGERGELPPQSSMPIWLLQRETQAGLR